MGLKMELPFVEIHPLGNLLNDQLEVVWDQIPSLFKITDNPWHVAAKIIVDSKTLSDAHRSKMKFKSDSPAIIAAQLANVRAWQINARVLDADKKAVVGWLLSEMLTDVPKFD